MKEVGKWWNGDINLVEIDGRVFALYGWNGYQYSYCWECVGEFKDEMGDEEYILTPQCDQNEIVIGYDIEER